MKHNREFHSFQLFCGGGKADLGIRSKDIQQRINTPLSLQASPHFLPQSLQQTLFIRGPLAAMVPVNT